MKILDFREILLENDKPKIWISIEGRKSCESLKAPYRFCVLNDSQGWGNQGRGLSHASKHNSKIPDSILTAFLYLAYISLRVQDE